MNYYSDTNSKLKQIRENFILSLATNDFLWLLLKYRKKLPTTNLLTKKKPPEIRYLVDNSRRFSDITTTWVKLAKYQSL